MEWIDDLLFYKNLESLGVPEVGKIITIPKGMKFFHGGKFVYHNVKYPIGSKFYSPVDKKGDSIHEYMKKYKKSKEDLVPEDLDKISGKVERSFFGSLNTASAYAELGCDLCIENKDEKICKCVAVFSLKENVKVLDLYNDYTLRVILESDFFSINEKNMLKEAYGIDQDEKLRNYNILKSLRNSKFQAQEQPYNEEEKEYFVVDKIIKWCEKNNLSGYSNPSVGRFSEVVFINAKKHLNRGIGDHRDWQYINTKNCGILGELMVQMGKYKTSNIDFHAGNLYAHSVWTALYTQELFDKKSPWVEGIPYKYKDLATFSAFLHDVGKMKGSFFYYDKPNHPKDGEDLLLSDLKNKDDLIAINLDKLLKSSGIERNSKNFCIIVGLVSLHWLFGKYYSLYKFARDEIMRDDEKQEILNLRSWEYIQNIKNFMSNKNIIGCEKIKNDKKLFLIFVKILIAVSISDIKGSKEFINNDKPFENRFVKGFKGCLKNYPKDRRGGNKYKEFEIDKYGLDFRRKIIKDIEDEVYIIFPS